MTDNSLIGKPLRYLIGSDSVGLGDPGAITVVPYDHKPVRNGWTVGYCNLLEEPSKRGQYGPYLDPSDTAEEYDERVIDPHGRGWNKNLCDQFELRRDQRIQYVELDNPDSYDIANVLDAINIASNFRREVIAKNPLLMGAKSAKLYVAHPNIVGAIVEKGAGNPRNMDDLRRSVGKPDLPVWFVAFGKGKQWANDTAKRAANYRGMGVTYSSRGEYGNSIDILVPRHD